MKKFITFVCYSILIVGEFKVLYERRNYLIEQIGATADEIKQIDERLAYLEPY